MATMSAEELLSYRHQSQRAQNTFANIQARANLASSLASGDYQRRARDIGVDYKRVRNAMPTSYNARGILRSGLFNQGKRELAAEKARRISDAVAARSRAQSLAQLDVSTGRSNLTLALAQIDAAKEARLADLAAIVEGASI